MKIHKLKTIAPYFQQTKSKQKTFELRKNDRDYQVGHILLLMEWNEEGQQSNNPIRGNYTGNGFFVKISHILQGGIYGLDKNFVILSLEFLDGVEDLNYSIYANRTEDELTNMEIGRLARQNRFQFRNLE